MMSYFTTPTTDFGILAWAFLAAQIIIAGVGVFLAFIRTDRHPLRGPLLRRLGYAMVALGVVGIIVASLRLGQLFPFTARYWFYLVALFEGVLALYALYYQRRVYPERARALAQQRSPRRVPAATPGPRTVAPQRQQSQAPAPTNGEELRPVSSRRGSRRDRKRRKRS